MTPPKKQDQEDGTKTISTNRKARYNFDVLDQLEVGLVLEGSEVKSLRQGTCSLAEAYGRIDRDELWIHGMYIAPYDAAAGWEPPPPRRPRKLLAHRQEIRRLRQRTRERGYTLVPLRVYFKCGKAKIALGVCKGRRTYDKKEALKRKDEARREARGLRED